MRDHRGNGKIERLIRTINERLRANKQKKLTKKKSGLSEILYALRVSKKKDGRSPFEKHMGKEQNTVKSNLVGKFMDISERDPKLDFQPSDFQDETDSTILVSERSKGSKLESTFAKKTGTVVNETEHTVSNLAERSTMVKTISKKTLRVPVLAKKQNSKIQAKDKPYYRSQQARAKGKSQCEHKRRKKWRKTPELAFDLENEQRPSIVEITSGTTGSESQQIGTSNNKQGIEQKATEDLFPKIEQNPGNEQKNEKSSKAGPTRVLEIKRCPTKRYGIDVMQLEKEKNTEEVYWTIKTFKNSVTF